MGDAGTMGGASASLVTTNTTQTITGAKTFSAAQTFDNYDDEKVITAPASAASGYARRYAKQVDANNDGLFVKRKINGAVVEVQL